VGLAIRLLWEVKVPLDEAGRPEVVFRAVKGDGSEILGLLLSPPDRLLEGVDVMLESREWMADAGGAFDVGMRRTPVIHGCFIAAIGFRRFSGSQIRHLAMKSTNNSSSALRICCSVLAPGLRRFPLELGIILGWPSESAQAARCKLLSQPRASRPDLPKKFFFRVDFSTIALSGKPMTSMMQASCSCSFSPGKIGKPV
jgi:hypothetical protein